MLAGLKLARLAAGLTQAELSEISGVHRDTIQKLETGQRPARPATIIKLANALGVRTEQLVNNPKEEPTEGTKAATKTEVAVRWKDKDGSIRGEVLRFRGQEIDSYEEGGVYFTLYECPGGYRVHVDYGGRDQPAYLNPSRHNHHTGEAEYPTYSPEELVNEFPVFGEAVGVYRVRDID